MTHFSSFSRPLGTTAQMAPLRLGRARPLPGRPALCVPPMARVPTSRLLPACRPSVDRIPRPNSTLRLGEGWPCQFTVVTHHGPLSSLARRWHRVPCTRHRSHGSEHRRQSVTSMRRGWHQKSAERPRAAHPQRGQHPRLRERDPGRVRPVHAVHTRDVGCSTGAPRRRPSVWRLTPARGRPGCWVNGSQRHCQ